MDEILTTLEEKISRVAALCVSLRAENLQLQEQLSETTRLRDVYAEKLDAARVRVEAVITQLPDA